MKFVRPQPSWKVLYFLNFYERGEILAIFHPSVWAEELELSVEELCSIFRVILFELF